VRRSSKASTRDLHYHVGVNTDSSEKNPERGADPEPLIREGDEHLRAGRGSEAERCFREAVAHQPDHPVALHRLGFTVFLRGDPYEAADWLRRCAHVAADDPTLYGHLAGALMGCGQVDEAIANWKRALELAPDYAAAYEKLGDAYLAKGDTEASEAAYRKSISLAPHEPRAFAGLGRMLHFSNRNEEAEEALHQALELGNGAPEIGILVGTVLLEAGGLDAALTLFEAAVHDQPDEAQGHASLGLALHWLGRHDEAEAAYRQALRIDARLPLALKHLGVLLQERDQLDAAAECFEKLLAANPKDEVARHMLAATRGETTPSAPAEYVTRLFDDYADRFDAHLGSIAYRVPTLICDALVEVAGSDQPNWRVLDLGCGTGLCGEVVRPLASFLAGVDLSARMIAKARERGIYDSLMVGSIDDALEEQEQSLDLIIAGDVFTYVGELSGVFAGCVRALRAGGLLAFSVESAEGDSYHLCPTGRYAHSSLYIEKTAEASGMTGMYTSDMVLRNDPVPIPGRIVVLSKAV
jgi:predicted TPR repeat methyltransferase